MKESSTILKTKRVKMTILNKKILWGLLAICIVFFLTGCHQHKELTEKEMLSIQYNMTKKEVERKLGKPQKVIQNSEQVRSIDRKFSETSSDRLIWQNSNLYIDFAGSEKNLKKVNKLMAESKTLTAYQYFYQNKFKEKSTWTIYFNKGKVIWMSFP